METEDTEVLGGARLRQVK